MIQPNGNAILIDFGIAKEIIPAGSSSTDYAANPGFAPYEQVYKGSKASRQPITADEIAQAEAQLDAIAARIREAGRNPE